MIGLAWRHEPMRPEDRERLVDTLTDAALGVIVRDLVDEATFDELIGPCTFLVGETAQPPPRAET